MADAESHFFPRLPAELRLKVWTFARPAPRLIHAHIKTGYELQVTLPGEVCLLVPHLAILGRKAPSVLQVCKESRAFLLPTYMTSLKSTRTLFPMPYQSGNWHPISPRDDALSNTFILCHHEALISEKKSTMYWDLENDIFSLHTEPWMADQGNFLAETAFLWSTLGCSGPKIHGIRHITMEFQFFIKWFMEMSPADPFYHEGRIVYVILNRRSVDGDGWWKRHLTTFMCWRHQLEISNRRYDQQRSSWELKIVARCDGDLSDGAFEETVSEHDIGGWREDPHMHMGPWLADEESWRHRAAR